MRDSRLNSLRETAEKLDSSVHFTDDALEAVGGAPRFIHSVILKGCIAWAKEHGVTELTAREIDIINEERKKKQ
ncbi:MAG: hypothetical protein HUJ66_02185 [Oscillospiraceae bacterium]|nr:hypothetical protein [Oscillospiraceae bacterium]